MNTNDTNKTNIKTKKPELIYGALSYKINGVLFSTHNELGPYAKEKQYADQQYDKKLNIESSI